MVWIFVVIKRAPCVGALLIALFLLSFFEVTGDKQDSYDDEYES
jgi:hypothetical protein